MTYLAIAQKNVTIGSLGAYEKARQRLMQAKTLYKESSDFGVIKTIDDALSSIPSAF